MGIIDTNKPKRKHRATGRRPGGARPGAGRKPGTPNVLPRGAVKALKVCGLRVPKEVAPEVRELADTALSRVTDVMMEKVSIRRVNSVLKSAIHVREEICGPVARQVNVDAKLGIGALLDETNKLEQEELEISEAERVNLLNNQAALARAAAHRGPIIRKASGEVIELVAKEIMDEVSAALSEDDGE